MYSSKHWIYVRGILSFSLRETKYIKKKNQLIYFHLLKNLKLYNKTKFSKYLAKSNPNFKQKQKSNLCIILKTDFLVIKLEK